MAEIAKLTQNMWVSLDGRY